MELIKPSDKINILESKVSDEQLDIVIRLLYNETNFPLDIEQTITEYNLFHLDLETTTSTSSLDEKTIISELLIQNLIFEQKKEQNIRYNITDTFREVISKGGWIAYKKDKKNKEVELENEHKLAKENTKNNIRASKTQRITLWISIGVSIITLSVAYLTYIKKEPVPIIIVNPVYTTIDNRDTANSDFNATEIKKEFESDTVNIYKVYDSKNTKIKVK